MTDWPTYIKDLRGDLTQRQFGQAIGATVGSISRWENGVVTPSLVYQKLIREFAEGRGEEDVR